MQGSFGQVFLMFTLAKHALQNQVTMGSNQLPMQFEFAKIILFHVLFYKSVKVSDELKSIIINRLAKKISAIPNLFSAKSKQTQNVCFFDKILGYNQVVSIFFNR